MNVLIVSNDLRQANSRAVAERDRWRRQYATVSAAIRRAKGRLRAANTYGNTEMAKGEAMVISALRTRADILMLIREDIAAELRVTAYRYAPREAVA
jgi:hypothetical protein